jgi:hypothetical protein
MIARQKAEATMRLSVLAAAAFFLAGCQSAITTTTSYDVLFRAGVPTEFGYAATAAEMPVVVAGNPFDISEPALDAAVIAAMQGHNRGSAVQFVQAPEEIAHSGTGYAVVMLLNSGPGIGADFACARRASLAPPVTQGRTTLLAVFCGSADARSWAYSGTGPVASPNDPLFLQLVRQATFLMIPPRDDDWGDSAFF